MKKISFDTMMAASMAACALLAACSGNGDDSPRLPVVQNIVEYAGTSEGCTTFIYYAPGSDNAEELRSRGGFAADDLAQGDALLLSYTSDPADPGYITVTGVRGINNMALLQTEPAGLAGWDSEGVYLRSAWRAGQRLNLRLNLTYDSEPRRFAIIVDKTTIDDPWPVAYLFHRRGTETPNFSREYYVSCPLTPLFSRDGIEGLKLRLIDTNTSSALPEERTLTFPT